MIRQSIIKKIKFTTIENQYSFLLKRILQIAQLAIFFVMFFFCILKKYTFRIEKSVKKMNNVSIEVEAIDIYFLNAINKYDVVVYLIYLINKYYSKTKRKINKQTQKWIY